MNKQYFEDYHDETFGALGGEGLGGSSGGAGVIGRVTTTPHRDGVHAKCLCERCGTSNEIIVEWMEAVAGSLELAPPNWHVIDGQLCPYVGCANPGCNTAMNVGFSPAELKALVARGVQSGVLPPSDLQTYLARCKPARPPGR